MPLIKADSPKAQRASTFSMKDIETYAKQVVMRAREQAEQLLAEAQQHGEGIRQQSFEEGRREGYEEGMRQGIEAGVKAGHQQALNEHKERLGQVLNALTQSLTELEQRRQMLEAEAVTDVIELAIAIARRVTKRQAEIDPGVLTENVAAAMKLVVHANDLRIAVNPQQKATLEEELPKLAMSWPALEHAELVEDPAVGVGGCRVYTRQGLVDGELEGQLDRVVADLLPAKKED